MKIFQLAALVVSATSPVVKAPRVAPTRKVRAAPVSQGVIVRRPLLASLRIYKKRRTLELPFYSDAIYGWAFSPDGRTLAGVGDGLGLTTLAGNKKIRGCRCMVFLFDVKTGRLKKRLLIWTGGNWIGLSRVIWSPDGRFVAAWLAGRSLYPLGLTVWDARSGQMTARIRWANRNVSAANWSADGTLFVAHSKTPKTAGNPFPQGEMLLCSSNGAAIRKTIPLGKRAVLQIDTRFGGAPRLLVQTEVGRNVAAYSSIIQSSVCQWANDSLSAPLVQLPVGDLAVSAAFNQNFVALSSFRQSFPTGGSFVMLANLKAKRIVWEKRAKLMAFAPSIWFAPTMQFSRNGHRIWIGGNLRGGIVVNTKAGAFSDVNTRDFPTFSNDEKYFVRPMEHYTLVRAFYNRGIKPHLAVAELWEK